MNKGMALVRGCAMSFIKYPFFLEFFVTGNVCNRLRRDMGGFVFCLFILMGDDDCDNDEDIDCEGNFVYVVYTYVIMVKIIIFGIIVLCNKAIQNIQHEVERAL